MSERLSALWGGVLTNRWSRIALALLAGAAAAQAAPITLFSDNFDGAQTTAAGVTAATCPTT